MNQEELKAVLAELLAPIEKKLDQIEHDQHAMRIHTGKIMSDVASVDRRISGIEEDIKYIKGQIDVVYDWVDRVDLEVKELKDR